MTDLPPRRRAGGQAKGSAKGRCQTQRASGRVVGEWTVGGRPLAQQPMGPCSRCRETASPRRPCVPATCRALTNTVTCNPPRPQGTGLLLPSSADTRDDFSRVPQPVRSGAAGGPLARAAGLCEGQLLAAGVIPPSVTVTLCVSWAGPRCPHT